MISTKTNPPIEERRRLSRAFIVIGARLVALVIGIGGGLIWFFGGASPAEVDLTTTASAVAASTSVSVMVSEDSEGTTTAGIEGAWTVDTSLGHLRLG